ncbi:MAG TPA: hypothetical protein PLO44_02985 [Candidatus Paceibacterota bacterium]|nr:hypothetical protein [Candidatus Paceibacterota bacterium]
MTNADWSIFVVTLLAYVFIALGIVKDKGKGQSAFSWFLWLILDVILFLSILDGNGKSIFMLAPSMLGSLVISILLYLCQKRKKIVLKDWEWINIFLISVTAIVWQVSKDPNTAIAFGVAAQVLAGVELSIESWKNPTPGWTTLGYLMFVASCVLSLATEGNAFTHFTIQDHLFPTMLGLQTVVDTIPLILKTFKKQ